MHEMSGVHLQVEEVKEYENLKRKVEPESRSVD